MASMYPVEYKVIFWDDYKNKNETVYGVTFAPNYARAMKNIEFTYGDSITEVKLFMNESDFCFEFTSLINEEYHGMVRVKDDEFTTWWDEDDKK